MSSRDDRQALCVQKWVDSRLRGTVIAPTGLGKSRVGVLAAKRFQKGNPDHLIIVVVPSEPVQMQWIEELESFQVRAKVITAKIASVKEFECSLLILDEIHKYASPILINMFKNIKYKVILGLTATFERTDGRDKILARYAPPIDEITLKEAIANGWLSKIVEYKVLINPPDIEVYNKINREFQQYFAFFSQDFSLAMSCASDWKVRMAEAKRRVGPNEDWHDMNKQIMINAAGFSRTLQARKKFISTHSKKLEIAKMILDARRDKKCLAFSSTIEQAEKLVKLLGYGVVYTGKDSAKKGRITLDEFKSMKTGLISSVAKLDTGFNDPTIQVGVIIGFNSSKTTSIQRTGRIIRANNPDEVKETFTLVLRGTQDEKWAQNSMSGRDFVVIDEEGLKNLLEGKDFVQKVDRPSHIMFTA